MLHLLCLNEIPGIVQAVPGLAANSCAQIQAGNGCPGGRKWFLAGAGRLTCLPGRGKNVQYPHRRGVEMLSVRLWDAPIRIDFYVP